MTRRARQPTGLKGRFAASNPVTGAPAPEIAAFLAQKTRQHHVVHFGSAVDQPRGARGAIDPFQNRVFGIAVGAIELDRGVGGFVQRVGDVHLGHRDFLAGAIAAIKLLECKWRVWKVNDELDAVLDRLEQQSEEVTLPEGTTARQFLGMVMRGEIDPPPKQIDAARVLIEYEEPKLSAVAVGHMDGTSFAAALERCLARSAATYAPKPALLPAPPEQHPASELKGNFPMRRRSH